MCLLPLNENFRHSRRRRFRHSYVVGCGVAKTNFFHFLIEKETLGQNDRSACLRSQVSLPFEEKKNEIPPFYCCMSFCLKFSFFLCSFAKIAFDMYLWLIEVNRMPIERELICEVQ